MPQRIDIHDGGTLLYDAAFFSQEEADAIFEQLRNATPWRRERGRFGPFPRLTMWYADDGLAYSYSGVTHEAVAWTQTLTDIRRRVELASDVLFNSVLLNYYRDGLDSMGYHADNEPELGANPVIASVSLGAVRQFVLKHPKTGDKLKFDLAHGSLLVMGGTCQRHWVHAVPKTKAIIGPRINLTLRQILS
ncbi:MAG: alpha-ketoglutarate-dependent dioxygenase AlkB [Acidobacteria bacterium]|nr:alpha-ketoglutarate-dependent dioxygenase AlkB [Acidobacteriota bacterium]MBM3994719.1 alpha-ketoglutarate-dependent dioxygenase AlkB [Planctomycetota bacterium]